LLLSDVGYVADTQRSGSFTTVDLGDGSRQLARLRLVLQDNDPRLHARSSPLDRLPPGLVELRRPKAHQQTADDCRDLGRR